MTTTLNEWECTRCDGRHGADFYMPHGCRVARMTHVLEVGDASGFWSLFQPHQVLALLRAAPAVAGPRVETSNGTCRPVTEVRKGQVSDSRGVYYGFAYENDPNRCVAADEKLRTLGYVLCEGSE